MKNNSSFIRLIFAAVMALTIINTSFASERYSDNTQNSESITRTFDVSKGFHAISSDVVGSVIFVQTKDEDYKLKITGPEDYINQIEVTVKEGVLTLIGKDKNFKKRRNIMSRIDIYIASPQISTIRMSGVGDFSAMAGIKANDLSIQSVGVGNITINNLECNKINVANSSIGNITLSGSANKATLKSEAVGSISAEDLKVKSGDATCAGVGNITCYALEQIIANADGIGSIRYRGNPKDKVFRKTGIGSIKAM